MLVEQKFDYSNKHSGYFWSREANAIKEEIANTHLPFFSSTDRNSQMIEGLNLTMMSNVWFKSEVSGLITLVRRAGLVIADYYLGLSGHVLIQQTNKTYEPTCRFLNKEPLRTRLRGKPIALGELIENVIYMFIILEDDDGFYFDFHPISIDGGTIISSSSGSGYTTDPLLITDNKIQLPFTPNGDIVFNTAHIHTRTGQGDTIADGGFSTEYDVKRATVDPTDNDVVLIHDDDDGIDVNGLYAVVSYQL